ncbi:hypothetical protein BGW42_000937 [Actinomortierella wolfii]|nr:hypothetical protein BGW42_000937 [Actinomortierella wolfii]
MAKLKMDMDPPSEAIHAGVVGLVMLVFILARVFTTRGFAAFKPGFNTRAVATWLAVSSLAFLVVYEGIMAYIQYKQSMGAYYNTEPFEQVMSNNRDTSFNATNLNLPARNITLWDLSENPNWDVWNRREFMGFFITGKPIGLYSKSDLDLFKALKILLKLSQAGQIACLLVLNTYWCRHVEALIDEGDFMSAREKHLYYALAIIVYVLPISLTLGLGYGVGDWRKADLATDISLYTLGFLTVIAYIFTVRRLQALNRDARNVDGEDTSVTLQLGYYIYCIYWLLASMLLIIIMGIIYDIEFLSPERNPVLAQAISDLMSSFWSTVSILVYPAATFLLYPSVDVLTQPKNDPAPRFKKKDRRNVGDPKKFRESLYVSDTGRDSNSLVQGDSSILGLTNISPPTTTAAHTAASSNGGGEGDIAKAEAGHAGNSPQDRPKRYSFYDPRQHQHMESIDAVVSGMNTIQEAETNGNSSQSNNQREEAHLQSQSQAHVQASQHQHQHQQQQQYHQQFTKHPENSEVAKEQPAPKSTKVPKDAGLIPTYIMDKDEQEAMSRWLAQYDDVDRAGFIAGLEMTAPTRPRRSQSGQGAEKQSQQEAQDAQASAPSQSRTSLERQSSTASATTATKSAGNVPLVGILKTRRSSSGLTSVSGLERKTSNKRMTANVTAASSHAVIDYPPPLPKAPPPTTYLEKGRFPPQGAPIFTPTDPFYQQQQHSSSAALHTHSDTDNKSRTAAPKRRRSNITTRVDTPVSAAAAVAAASAQQPLIPTNTQQPHRLLTMGGSFEEHRRQLHPAASGFLSNDPYPSVGVSPQGERGSLKWEGESSNPSSRRSSVERDSSSQPPTPTSKKYKAPPPPLPIHEIMQKHDPSASSPISSRKSTPVTPPGVRPKRSQDNVIEPHIFEIAERIYQEQASMGFPSPPPFQRSASSPSTLGTQTIAPSGPGRASLSSTAQQHQNLPLPPVPTTQSPQHQPPPFRERELSFEEKVAAFVARSKAMNEALAAQKAAAQAQAQAQASTAGPSVAPVSNPGHSPKSSVPSYSGAQSAPGGSAGGTHGEGVAGNALSEPMLDSELETPTTISTIGPASPMSPRYPISTAAEVIQDPSVPPSPPSPPSTASPTLTAGPTTLPRPLTPAWFENKTSFSTTADVYNHYQNVMRRAAEARSQHRGGPTPSSPTPSQADATPIHFAAGPSRGSAAHTTPGATSVGSTDTGGAHQQSGVSPVPVSVIPDSVFDRYQEDAKIGPLDEVPSPIQLSPLPSEASPLTVPSDRRSSESTVRALGHPSTVVTSGATAAPSTAAEVASPEARSSHHHTGSARKTLAPPSSNPNNRDRHSFLTATDSQSLYSNWTAELSDVTQTSGEVSVGAFADRRNTGGSGVARHDSHPQLKQQSSTTSNSTFGGGGGSGGGESGGSGSGSGSHGGHDTGDDSTSSRSKRVSDIRKSHASSASGGTFGSHYGSSNLSFVSGPLMTSNPVSIGRSPSMTEDNKSNMWKSTSVQLSVYGEEDEDTTSTQAVHDATEIRELSTEADQHERRTDNAGELPVTRLVPGRSQLHNQEVQQEVSASSTHDAVQGDRPRHDPYELSSIYFKTTDDIQRGLLPQPSPPLQQQQQQQQPSPTEAEMMRYTSMSNTSSGQPMVRSAPSSSPSSSRPSQDQTNDSSDRAKSPSVSSLVSQDRSYSPRVVPMMPLQPPPIPARSSSRSQQMNFRAPTIPSRAVVASQLQMQSQAQAQAQQQPRNPPPPSIETAMPHSNQLYYDSGDSIHTLRARRDTQSRPHQLHDDDDTRSDPSSAPSSPPPIISLATRLHPYSSTTGELDCLERGTASPPYSAATGLHSSPSLSSSSNAVVSAVASAAHRGGDDSPSAQLAKEIFDSTMDLHGRDEGEEEEDGGGEGQYGGDDEREDDDDEEEDEAEWARNRSQMTSPLSSDVGSEYRWESAEINRHQWIMLTPGSPEAGPSPRQDK